MNWDAISGLLPAVLAILLILRKASRRRDRRRAEQAMGTPPPGRGERDYDPIEPS